MSTNGITIGIDNGKGGGMVAIGPEIGSSQVIASVRMPLDDAGEIDVRAVRAWIAAQASAGLPLAIVVEEPLKHMKSSRAVASLNKGFGLLMGMLRVSTFPALTVRLATAQPGRGRASWQRQLLGVGITKRGSDTKALALEFARQVWPGETWVPKGCRTAHDGIVDAALMALWHMTIT